MSSLEAKYRPKNLPIYFQYRKFKWSQFFVGLFGALAILGVLLKLWKPAPFWGLVTKEEGQALFQIFMPIGFLGEIVVFIIMGFMKGDEFVEVYPDEMEGEEEEEHPSGIVVNMELPDTLKELIEDKVAQQLDGKVSELTNLLVEDVEKTRGLLVDTNEINSKIQGVAQSLADFTEKMKTVSDRLGEFENVNAAGLSTNANSVSERLETAGGELRAFEDEMKKLATRFRNFNAASN